MNKIFRKAIVLALAGSALLYTGCTKDYSGDIQTLRNDFEEYKTATNEQIRTLNGQVGQLQQAVSALETTKAQFETAIKTLQDRATALETFKSETTTALASIRQNIADLQTADQNLNSAIEAAKARIKALEDNTYTKQEVDGKIADVKAWANETFATKETVGQIDAALAQVAGTVDGILAVLVDDEGELINVREALIAVKATAEEALGKANQALSETEAIRNDLVTNYYNAEAVDALLTTLRNDVQAKIDAETAAREAGDAAAQARIDSLAQVTKDIEADLANFKEATAEALEALDGKIDQEIANRLIAEALLKQEIADTAAAIRTFVKDIEEALNAKIETNAKNIKDLQDEYEVMRGEVDVLIANVIALDLYTQYLGSQMDAYAERIQSIVFVPEYDDLKASMLRYFIGQPTQAGENFQNTVIATFEVQPKEAIVWVDSLYKDKKIGIAFKSVESRALYFDEVVYDVEVELDEEKGRFTVEAFLGPDVEENIVISCILGDFEVDGYDSGNAIQSTYVAVANKDDYNTYLDGSNFAWYDAKLDEPVGTETENGDSVGVALRIAYTAPATDSLVFKPFTDSLAIFMKLDGTFYQSIAEYEENLHLPAGLFDPIGYVAEFQTKDAGGHILNGNEPFEFADEAYAPETSLTTTTTDEGVVNPAFVGYNNVRKEGFRVLGVDIEPYAFVGTVITKNQVPEFTVEAYEIPWSYVHYAEIPLQTGKAFAVDGNTDFGKAISGAYNGADETFTKDGEDYTPALTEWINFIPADGQVAGMVKFFGWAFEADSAKYVAKTERFETDSDEYTVNVPFTLCPKAKDRKVIIPMGTLDYSPTYGLDPTYIQDTTSNALPGAIAPAFAGDEDLFIGDAAEFAPGYEAKDSLYSAYANLGSAYHCFNDPQVLGSPITESFVVDSVRVNGELDEDAIEYITVNLAYDVDGSMDASTISIEPGYLPYDAEVTVYGRYNQFFVNFYYEISFNTPAVPFFLVLTPYGAFDPAKDKTIIVEGDDKTDPDLYTLQQMYYTKYLRVQDQEGVPTDMGEELEVRFTYVYEDFEEFGIELDPETATADEIEAAQAKRGVFGGITDVVEVLSNDKAGLLDQQAILTWGTYQGLKVKAFATLYDNGVRVSEPLEYAIETMKPIKLTQPLVIGSVDDPLIRTSGESLDIRPASAMIVGGILSRDAEYNPYYVADPSVFGYNDNNVRQEGTRVQVGPWFNPSYVYYPAGEFHPFYGPLDEEGEGRRIVSELFFDYDHISAILNDHVWDLTNGGDWSTSVDDYGEIFTLIKDSGKGRIVLNIPVKFRYYLDYCGAKAEEGFVTVYIKQI
jgi:chaperonin cofactor prefoldin